MTFYEAAVQVLEEAGEPMHFRDITSAAIEKSLLSHVGRVPEATMQARLYAMVKRETDRKVIVVGEGQFALAEWGGEHDEAAAEATAPRTPDVGPPLRPRERTPMNLKEAKATRNAERSGRFEADDRAARNKGKARRRRPKEDETPADALEAIVVELGGGPIDLDWVVQSLEKQPELPEGFPEDIEGLKALAAAENAAREEASELLRFTLEQDLIGLVPKPKPKRERRRRRGRGRGGRDNESASTSESALVVDTASMKEAVDTLAEQLAGFSPEAVENLVIALCTSFDVEDMKVAKRSAKGSPLYTGQRRIGLAQFRVAIRILVHGRDVRPDDIVELREDLEHYSAAAGFILTTGKVPAQARSSAEDNAQKPVAPFDGQAVAQALVSAGIGVQARIQKTYEVDEDALEALSRGDG